MTVARPVVAVAVALLSLWPAAAARADDDWIVTTADFQSQPGTLRGLSPDGVRVTTGADPTVRTVPLDAFVSAQRTAGATAAAPPAASAFTAILADGDRLVGEPGGLSGETLTWAEPVLGRVPVGLGRVVVIGRGVGVTAPDERPKQDVATLANGDAVAGIVTGLADGKLTVQGNDGGTTTLPLANVTRIALASTGGAPPAAAAGGHAFRVRLASGSALTASAVAVDGDRVSLTLAGRADAKPVSVRLDDVAGIEQLNGPVGWLSSRTPTESVQVPYVGPQQPWPARFDRAVDGSPLAFDGRAFDRGIGVHAYSRLTFAVDPRWMAFRTRYAIDSRRDAPRLLADVTVRVKVDGKTVHEAAHVRAGVLSPIVRVDLTGAKTLTLECDYGPAGDTQAHLNWLQPALLRGAAATPPTTAPAGQP